MFHLSKYELNFSVVNFSFNRILDISHYRLLTIDISLDETIDVSVTVDASIETSKAQPIVVGGLLQAPRVRHSDGQGDAARRFARGHPVLPGRGPLRRQHLRTREGVRRSHPLPAETPARQREPRRRAECQVSPTSHCCDDSSVHFCDVITVF